MNQQATPEDEAHTALIALAGQIATIEERMRASPFFDTEQDRVKAYQHMVRTLISSLEIELLQEPEFPYFRATDFWLREGADSPDQIYATALIRPDAQYRVWGKMGSTYRLEVQLYAGDPWASSGHSAGYLPFESIPIAADGSFEIYVGGTERSGPWMPTADDVSSVLVRQIYQEWNEENPGELHIDCIGFEGKRHRTPHLADIAQKLRAAATMFERRALGWPKMVSTFITGPHPVNVVPRLEDRLSLGGVADRLMSMGHFDLPKGKALVIRAPQTHGTYHGVQLLDRWFTSLEYSNLISSLNPSQAVLAPDDAYYYVIAGDDPGYANWLDTGGLVRGVFILRYDGVKVLTESMQPTAELVDLDRVADCIPGYKRVSDGERERVHAVRRKHLQVRSNR